MGEATWTSSLSSTISGLARSTNTLSNALLSISAHYDISNDMFAAFLSEDMTYSSALWSLECNSDTETLEEAQMRKLNRHIDDAKIKRSDHVLEIVEQKGLAGKRIAAAGLSDRIKVKLMDYRSLSVKFPFDKVVSFEMLEHMGREYLDTYFQCVHKLLKPDGIATFQCITIPEARYEAYSRSEDFIRKYIFPNGHLPSISQLISSISNGSEGTLIVEKVENISGHYSKTLRLWKEKFSQNYDSIIRPALMAQHKGMDEKKTDVFKRKWEYYFSYCEAGFATKTWGDVTIIVGREGTMELIEQIPL